MQAYVDGESAELTPTEFRLLYQLALDRGRVSTRDELLQKLWGRRESHRDRTVDVFVRRLREKIDRHASRHTFIQTRYGVGYKLEPVPKAGRRRCGHVASPTPPRHRIDAHAEPARSAPSGMKFAVVAHRRSETNDALVAARAASGLRLRAARPRDALRPSSPETSRSDGSTSAKSSTASRAGPASSSGSRPAACDVLNPPAALVAAHDKLLTARVLRRAGVPHPRTWLIAEAIPPPAPELPVVLKPRFGSWGRDVVLCPTADELDAELAGCAEAVVPRARRARAGARPAARLGSAPHRRRRARRRRRTPRRPARGEWRTNVALGAQVEPAEPPPLARALALEAAPAVARDLVGVDLLPTPTAASSSLEVNGAVDFRPVYAPVRDVFPETVAALLEDGVRQPERAAASL